MHTASRVAPVVRRLAGAALLLTACAPPEGERAVFGVRDSAGVAISWSTQPRWSGAGWQVADTPSLRMGGVNDPEEPAFAGVIDVRRTGDGSILVAERTGIRHFDRAGTFVRRIGREGAGPGEFGYIMSLAVCGRRIVVGDFMRRPLSVFDASTGELMASRAVTGLAAGTVVRPVACTRDGFVAQLLPRPERQTTAPDVRRTEIPLVTVDSAFVPGDTLAIMLGPELYDGLTRPFGRQEAWTASADSLYTMDTAAGEVHVRALAGGGLRRIVRIALPARAVTADDVARIRAQYLDGVPPALAEREILPRLDAVPIPDRMPAASRIEVDATGHLWVRLYQPFRDQPVRTWHVIAPDGAWLGPVVMPDGFTPYVFAADEVLGVWRDELGVEYVHAYAIVRAD